MPAIGKLPAGRPPPISSARATDSTTQEVADCAHGASHIAAEYPQHSNKRSPVLALSEIPESPLRCAPAAVDCAPPYDAREESLEPSEHKSGLPLAPASPDHGFPACAPNNDAQQSCLEKTSTLFHKTRLYPRHRPARVPVATLRRQSRAKSITPDPPGFVPARPRRLAGMQNTSAYRRSPAGTPVAARESSVAPVPYRSFSPRQIVLS